MNTAHWHLLLNHLPVIGTVIGTGILIAGYILQNNRIVKLTALGVFIFSSLFAIPAYLTGEGAEDVVEKLPGVSENIIEHHEDKGTIFLILTSIIGVLSIGAFVIEKIKNKSAPFLYFLILLVSFGTIIFARSLATSGGEIRHTEIRAGSVGSSGASENVNASKDEEKEDED